MRWIPGNPPQRAMSVGRADQSPRQRRAHARHSAAASGAGLFFSSYQL